MREMGSVPIYSSRASAFALLAAANLFWAGNWVLGRALREAFDPVSLNFYRWLVALVALAPFALPGLAAKRELIRRHAGLLALLALLSVSVFQSLVYLGLKSTTAVTAVLINCAGPLFIVLAAWTLDGERATPPPARRHPGVGGRDPRHPVARRAGGARRARVSFRRRLDRGRDRDLGRL